MMGRHVACLLLECPQELPERFRDRLCSTKDIIRGKGRNTRITSEGLLHTTGQRPEYWYEYIRKDYVVEIRDAALAKQGLDKTHYSI
jgi:hypothetical protein